MNNWSLTEKIFLYISYDRNRVYIANPESKGGPRKSETKLAEFTNPPITIDNNGAKIKVHRGNIYLDVDGKYLRVINIFEEKIIDQFSGATITNGEGIGVVFGFSPIYKDKVIVTFPGTPLHKKIEDEFLRKVSLSLYKKTTKFTPGNRYETETGSLWYLGEYDKKQVFSNYLPDSKKASDIWENSLFTEIYSSKIEDFGIDTCSKLSIYFSNKPKSMVDCGKELDIDKDPESSIEARIEKFMITNKKEYSMGSNRFYYSGISNLFSIFDIIPITTNQFSEKAKNLMKEILCKNLYYIAFTRLGDDIYNHVTKVGGSSNTDDGKIKGIISILLGLIEYSYRDKIKEVLERLFRINLYNVTKEVLDGFTIPEMNDFSDYINNIVYHKFRTTGNFIKSIDMVNLKIDHRKISKFLPNGPYRDVIVDVVKKALDTNGANVECFNIKNIGTERKPCLEYEIRVTLEDIKNYYGVTDITLIPENIKSDLIKLKIYELDLITRSSIDQKFLYE